MCTVAVHDDNYRIMCSHGEWPEYLKCILTIEQRASLFSHYSSLGERNLVSEKLNTKRLNMEVRRLKIQSCCNTFFPCAILLKN